MGELTANVNWLAVLVGAVLAFVLGWLWYSPMLFGKQWAEGNGIELGTASSMPMAAMVTQAIGLLGLAWAGNVLAGMQWTWWLVILAFAVLMLSGGMFAKRSQTVSLIDAGYIVGAGLVIYLVNLVL